MQKLILIFAFITFAAYGQEVPNFTLSADLTSGLPTNLGVLSTCSRPGESKSFQDVEQFLDSADADSSQDAVGGASAQ